MATSGTYVFSSPQSQEIIEDAYQRIGIIPAQLDFQQIHAAQRSINFILQSWINKGLNLWTTRQGMISLVANQASYLLPNFATDILEATIRTSTRNLGGTAFSSAGGNAQSAFDNNSNTACTQTAPDGYISYSWGAAQYAIAMVGIQSNATLDYTLSFQYSPNNIDWTNALSVPTQTYAIGINQWFVIPIPVSAKAFRVIETGGATLNIQELYFNTLLQDTIVSRFSRSEYIATPLKLTPGRPTSFYVDRQINPVVYIWPVPTAQYNNLFFTYIQQMQDVGSMQNVPQVPARFLEALCAKLSHMLALKNPQTVDIGKVQYLDSLAEREYDTAGKEDRERVPLRIYGDYMQGWTAS